MKRPSDWPLYFILYPMIFRICPVLILVIVQEISKKKVKWRIVICILALFMQSNYNIS